MFKNLGIDLAYFLRLPIKIFYKEKIEKGYLSSRSNNPFGDFYLHEKPKKKFVSKVILHGELRMIKKITFF